MGNTTPQDRNFGKLMALQGIQANNLSTGAIVTATSSQILAISFIKDLTGTEISWMKWFIASAPVAIITLAASFHIGKMLFKTVTVLLPRRRWRPWRERVQGTGKNGQSGSAGPDYLPYYHLFVGNEDGLPWRHNFGFGISRDVVPRYPHAPVRITTGSTKDTLGSDDFRLRRLCGKGWPGRYGRCIYLGLKQRVGDKLGVEHMSFMVLYAVVSFSASPKCSPTRRFVPSF